nr:SIMPL domain-containing protein [Aliikangiella sp. G2MR2-5]
MSFSIKASPQLKGSPEDLKSFLHPLKNTVTISDTVVEKAFTDKAIVSLIVTTEGKTMTSALQENRKIRDVIYKALHAAGVSASNINNARFSSSPQYGWFGDAPNSFEVSNRVQINIFNENQLQALAKLADSSDDVFFAGAEFKHTEREQFQRIIKQKVLRRISEQKKDYQDILGIKLKAIGFHAPNIQYGASFGAKEYRQKKSTIGSRTLKESQYEIEISDSHSEKTLSTGFDEVEYRMNISVIYEVLDQ